MIYLYFFVETHNMSNQQTNIEPIQDNEIIDITNDAIIEEVLLSSNSSDMEITTDTDNESVILESEYNVNNNDNDNFLASQTTQEPLFVFARES